MNKVFQMYKMNFNIMNKNKYVNFYTFTFLEKRKSLKVQLFLTCKVMM